MDKAAQYIPIWAGIYSFTVYINELGVRLKNPLTDNYLQKKVATCDIFTTFALL